MSKRNINKNQGMLGAVWAYLRIGLGFVFFWAFIDKLFGLGFATCRAADTGTVEVLCEKAWLSGGSPTAGFLQFGTDGVFASFYQGMAGNVFIDWLFMIGMAAIGTALILGIGIKIAAVTGSLMMLMMWSAALLPANNPFMDDHLIYMGVLAGIYLSNDSQRFGLGSWWKQQEIVKKYPILR